MAALLAHVEEIAYVFGGVLVVLYALFAFNKPHYSFGDEQEAREYGALARPGLPKYMTEPYRYRMFCLVFVLFALTQYLLLAQLVPILPGVGNYISQSENKELLRAGNAILSALLLLGLVEFVRWPRELLFGFVKKWLHDFAKIPDLARDLFESLCYESLDFEAERFRENLAEMVGEDGTQRRDLQRSDFQIGNSRNMLWRWARLSYGIHVLEKWSRDSLYDAQLREVALGWKPLHQRYRDSIDEVEAYRLGELGEEQAERLSAEIDEMLANCHRLIACLVIMVARPSEDPLSYIRRAGYRVMPGNRFALHGGEVYRLIMAIVPAIILIALLFTLIPLTGEGESVSWGNEIQRILRYILGALIILIFPVLLVLGFKRHMSMERSWPTVTAEAPYASFFEMPLSLYTLLSLLAWAGSTVLMVLTSGASPDQGSMLLWKKMAFFCFISAVTAFFTAYRVDIPPRVYNGRAVLLVNRCKSAFLQGSLTALVVWAGLQMFSRAGGFVQAKLVFMAFAIAVVLNITLFWGKHTHDRRRSSRLRVKEEVTAIVGGARVEATLITTSSEGASLRVKRRDLQPPGAEVELVREGDGRRLGRVVGCSGRVMHISFAS